MSKTSEYQKKSSQSFKRRQESRGKIRISFWINKEWKESVWDRKELRAAIISLLEGYKG